MKTLIKMKQTKTGTAKWFRHEVTGIVTIEFTAFN